MEDFILTENEIAILKKLKFDLKVSPFSMKFSESELTRCAENLKKYGLISFDYDREEPYIGRPCNFKLTKKGEQYNPY